MMANLNLAAVGVLVGLVATPQQAGDDEVLGHRVLAKAGQGATEVAQGIFESLVLACTNECGG